MEPPLIEPDRWPDPKPAKHWLWACGTFQDSPAIANIWLFTRWFRLLVILIGCQPDTKPSPSQPASIGNKDTSDPANLKQVSISKSLLQPKTFCTPLILDRHAKLCLRDQTQPGCYAITRTE